VTIALRARRAPVLLSALAAASAVAGTACGGRRERLDVPQIALDVADQSPPAGGRVTGHVSASDASGLTLLAVYACTTDSIFRQGFDLDRARSAGFDFSLYVASTTPPGAEIEVYAVARDDQGFYTDTARALTAGAAAAPVTSDATPVVVVRAAAAAEAICPRVIRARRAPLPVADAPTAPRP
jgi:hypothetical protein